jgi:hypothetical protein
LQSGADAMAEDEKRQSGGVVDHLQAPRKKKKDYVVLAFNGQSNSELCDSLENFVRLHFKALTTVRPKNSIELQRLFSRQIVLLLVEDSFADNLETVKIVRQLKEKKLKAPIPVIFFTENPDGLVAEYNKHLGMYQEVDTYVNFRNATLSQMTAKVAKSLTEKSVRKSRRYTIDVPVSYFHLTKNKEFQGKLADMSVHGAILRDANNELFRSGDQIRVNIPFGKFVANHQGDFIKVAAKVRRVFIDGCQVGISWEYLSAHQLFQITSYLTELVNDEMYRKAMKQKTLNALQSQKK